REVWVEVGYDLEEFITDGFAGETSRQYMVPEIRRGRYGAGLLAGVSRIISRIAESRNVTLQGVRPSRPRDVEP
ncbi:TPM domain-containing protein, partial [Salmonella enterica]|uniref:TPM domain-containing protein n=1 Tax=Salmonella enterica TaxID=28901 RepID=UPI003EDC277D